MLNVVLFQPEIPPNTGNIIRLCANAGAALHLIAPYGFELSDRTLRRAGLDYHASACLTEYADFSDFQRRTRPARLFACTTRGTRFHHHAEFTDGDFLMFGPETRGLPADILQSVPAEQWLRIPMVEGSRSINLSNATSIVLYEAWRQLGFDGAV